MRKILLILLSLPALLFDQIIFDKAPEDFQLFPRNENNKASVFFLEVLWTITLIIITLKGNQKYFSIAWPPNKTYLNTEEIDGGPWIYGLSNNIGALSFDNRKIN